MLLDGNELALSVIGLTEEEATRFAILRGFSYRVIERDDTPYVFTLDMRRDRLNFVVKNGVVTGATCG